MKNLDLLPLDRPIILTGFAELFAEFSAYSTEDLLLELRDPDEDPIFLPVNAI
jgi:hypothetical protein